MEFKFNYVFIIGAGGSKPYGFPTGYELYENIQKNYPQIVDRIGEDFKPPNMHEWRLKAKELSKQLKKTTCISIDKYLNINKQYIKIGTNAIASEIYKREAKAQLPFFGSNKNGSDWYSYLYSKLIEKVHEKEDFLKLHELNIAFISFNYDRSLEHFFFENLYGLVENSGITRQQLAESFNQIPFIHVYGSLGKLPWQANIFSDASFEVGKNFEYVKFGKSGIPPFNLTDNLEISLIYEDRKEKPEISKAHELIKNADRILFLGFGYDEKNLEVLDLPNLLENKRVYGTALDATKNEIEHLKNLLNFEKVRAKSEIYNFDNLMLLREHLI
jgi:hypothetical protein